MANEPIPDTHDSSVQPPRRSRRVLLWIAIPFLLLIAIGVYVYRNSTASAARDPGRDGSAKSDKSDKSKAGGRGGRGEGGPTPVIAARARKGDIGVYFDGLGTVTPIYTVTVRSRVDGELIEVRYKEGEMVQKGEVLAQIDPRPFQVQLTQAEGQLAKDQASLANARVDLTRYETLLRQNAIQEQQVATQRAVVAQDEGTVKSDLGQVESAHLNLTYAHITAPITGRIGLRLVDPGNIVHASDPNGLLVITQVQPISVLFTITEDQLPAVMKKLRAGAKLGVEAYDREMQHRIAQGALTTVDNQIDQATGTVRLRATFANNAQELFPNQFVNARLLVETKRGVILIPTAGIQRSTNSTFVYLVKPDSTVTIRNVKTGTTEGDESEVTDGLQAGDVVVMAGADRLQEGSPVQVQIEGENPQGGRGGAGGSGGSGASSAKGSNQAGAGKAGGAKQ
jgi:multidrug efflux system membrane fusion protein